MLTVHLFKNGVEGGLKTFDGSVTPKAVAQSIGPRLAKDAIAAKVGDKVVGVDFALPAEGDVNLTIFTKSDPEALAVMRHSCAHVMARAIMRLFPGVQLAFGPTTENGFYYDVLAPTPISEEDFPKIEAEMAKIIQKDEAFERFEDSREDALTLATEMNQKFKVEHINDGLKEYPTLSFYRQGEFIDLCRGPHVPSAGAIGAFKLLSIAGAYWKGDENNPQLQRIYGTAFFDKKDQEAYLERIEEAKRRDHRVLGRKLHLYTINPTVGAGLVLWMPKGAKVRQQLEGFIRDELMKRGYDPVYTPSIGKVDLYQTSGHFPYYKESMFEPIKNTDGETYILKPMNCPHHCMIYQAMPRSYRELPVRLAEFGTVHRYEKSGELGGMTRVRGFTQDDAHLFCTPEQVAEEFRGCLEMTKFVLETLGLTDYRVRLGFRDPKSNKYVGGDARWNAAEDSLKGVCQDMNLPAMSIEQGEAAFYGPKADFVVRDCIGREWQLGTVQLDYNLPSAERFNLSYIGPDNKHHHPVMIHRAPLGSMERFIGVLIEHFAGAFPLWLAPEQVRVLAINEKFEAFARTVERRLREAGLRVTGDYRSEDIRAKIKHAQIDLTPYMFVIGGREAENDSVAVRDRIDGDIGTMPVAQAIEKLVTEVRERRIRQVVKNVISLTGGNAANEY